MRDEFNNSSNYDEFSGCDVKEDHVPMEYDMPSENGQSIEFRMPVEYFENNSYGDDSGKDSHNNKLKKRHKIKMMAYLVASCAAVLTVLQVNPLKALDYVKNNSNSNDVVEPVGDWGYDNDMHILKPVLENGSPNGAVTVPQYGLENVVLDEEYMYCQEKEDSYYYLWSGAAYSNPVSGGNENAYYDYDTNTLHLKDCNLEVIAVNLMGNDFTIEVEGECHIGYICSYGFYYGNSITIKGSEGILYVNEDGNMDYGIEINAEDSKSGLFIDKMAGLTVGGKIAPVCISYTDMEHAVYWNTSLMELKGDYNYLIEETSDSGRFNNYLKENNSNNIEFTPIVKVDKT
ncbi:hypothetical protein [Eshraghiella crossota]|jgi:hypothetical protein|uniref:hypothetical protein n=1 Tax=Eshraghiella crossota TaxID=45851 RepID=UPI003FD8DFC9